MNYKFQEITTLYPQLIKETLDANPNHQSLSYEELHEKVKNIWFGTANLSDQIKYLGNEAQKTIYANFEALQKAWAREHGIDYREENWQKEIVIAQVKVFQPDVLWLKDLYFFQHSLRQALREACDHKVLMIGWRAAPTPDYSIFGDLNIMLSCVPHFVERFQQHGVKAVLMLLGFEHTVLDVVKPKENRELDFTFVGSVGNANGTHSQRYKTIEQLMDSTSLQVWGIVNEPSRSLKSKFLNKTIYQGNKFLRNIGVSKESLAKIPLLRRGKNWRTDPNLPSVKQRHPARFHEPLFGKNYQIMANSKIVFNSHVDAAENYAGNMRLYEATGMGACLLTDWKKNIHELFEPDVEVVTYRSTSEAIEKVRYLLEHEEERKAIARAGKARTLREHTYAQRAIQLDEIIQQELKSE